MQFNFAVKQQWLRALLMAGTVVTAVTIGTDAWADDDPVTPAIPGVVAGGVKISLIKDGFTGTEGPIGLPDGSLIFTETQANRITRIDEDENVTTYIADSNGANGLALSPSGELYAVQTLKPRVGIIHPAEKTKILAEKYNGKPLNRPNDLVLDKKGGVYFTDPGINGPLKPGQSPTQPAVYYIKPSGELLLIDSEIKRPNGIQLSPDEKVLYVANTAGEYVIAFDVAADGSVSNKRNFAKLEDALQTTENGPSSGADGLAVDSEGRLYVAANTGIQVFTSKGEFLGNIVLPKKAQNIAFAGKDKRTFYIVGRGSAYKFPTLAQGYTGRAK
ncbi:SMP-30/gluconolactonase/LRE family protein [Methylobacillus arboreus]|uniref:SMP-30/gluconolactonase/LRE family protein n=1 Tax=Methylobacillus arboreus TaxID=755170 RepID=UPI001E637746|nr:SMP-30/gluconolactonase/LRE family protein [Methylobacillus arboreus]MCB5189138.1 SMP-30/gluconolactonase/LRE family protein [Methylobacillus arboreus]